MSKHDPLTGYSLEGIAEARATRDAAQNRLDAYAASAARNGYSWAQIGEAAGVSRQAAQQRWGRFRRSGDHTS